jgi:polyhydroxyalkanoate synthesis repressor PhaR
MAKKKSSHPRLLEIRKYSNRRYYDSTRSCHITLEEIRRLIREGYDIRVIDSKTSTDITGQVLAQVILDLDTEKLELLPAGFLTRNIRFNYDLVENYIGKYLNQTMLSFMDWQHQAGPPPSGGQGWPSFPGGGQGWPIPPWGGMGVGPTAPAEPAPERSESGSVDNLGEQLEALQREVEQLRKSVGGSGVKASAKSKAKAKKNSANAKK